jgi:pimeloyl-ACP methyl ester carboxylesterase
MHEDFVRGLNLTGVRFEEIEVPYENSTLHGYFFPAYTDGRKAPTVIVHQGFDGVAEECWFSVGADAVSRGYNVLAFDGPGQGRAVRLQGLHFRPDWEAVVSPVVDWTLTRPETDPDRIVLYGISMGGYLAPRAAAYEPRLRAVIANEGVYDAFESSAAGSGMTADELRAIVRENASAYNLGVAGALEKSVQTYWVITHGLWAFGVQTPADLMVAYEAYTMKDAAGLVRCPVLVIEVETTQFFMDQSHQLYDALPPGKRTLMTFSTAEGAGLHCQAGAQLLSNQRIFDWLDEELSGEGTGRRSRISPVA